MGIVPTSRINSSGNPSNIAYLGHLATSTAP